LRLCSRAPRMTIRSLAIDWNHTPAGGRGTTRSRPSRRSVIGGPVHEEGEEIAA
jgi:hypothetical protein